MGQAGGQPRAGMHSHTGEHGCVCACVEMGATPTGARFSAGPKWEMEDARVVDDASCVYIYTVVRSVEGDDVRIGRALDVYAVLATPAEAWLLAFCCLAGQRI